jgi:multidrug efflux pump subunit AcrB
LEVKEFADQSLFVRAAVNSVVKEGVIAALLTAVMILLFLGSWRSTFIIALSIPLSVLSSLALLSALGETINLMTLGGLALAVGILVDDATVEIENIHRQMALGKSRISTEPRKSLFQRSSRRACICIVFVPMFFLPELPAIFLPPGGSSGVCHVVLCASRTLIPTLVMWFYRNLEYRGHLPDAAWFRCGCVRL